MADLSPPSADEWRRNWPVVLAGLAGVALTIVHLYSTGVMIVPLEQEFGWSRAQISSGLMIHSLFGVVMAPAIGGMVDRVGARRIALFGAPLLCAALAALAMTTSSIWSWWILWALLSVAGGMIGNTVWTAGVASLFSSGRGLALAITLCGNGLGAMIVPIATQLAVQTFGWRMAYVVLAGSCALLTLPLIYMFFTSAIDRRRMAPPDRAAARADYLPGISAAEAWKSPRFIKLACAASIVVLVTTGIIPNIVLILSSQGMTPATAAAISGLVGVGSITGRLCGGYLLDRLDANRVAAVSVLFPIVTGALLLAMPGSVSAAFLAVLLLGLAVGAEYDAVAYLVTRHFGLRNYGGIFGVIAGLATLMAGAGPFASNALFDITGSYAPALMLMIGGCLLASAIFLMLGPYPSFEDSASHHRD